MLPKDIEYILAIAESRSISLAAKRLFITQPALSHYIKTLEQQTGSTLFRRNGNGVVPTAAGQLYIEAARQISGIYSNLQVSLDNNASHVTGTLHIVAPIWSGSKYLPPVVPEYHRHYPLVDIRITESDSDGSENMIRNGDADVAFLAFRKTVHNISYIPLEKNDVVLYVPKNHPANNHASVKPGKLLPLANLADFSDDIFLLFRRSWQISDVINDYFKVHDFTPRQIMELENPTTMKAMAAEGLGVTFSTYHGYVDDDTYNDRLFVYALSDPPPQWTMVLAYRDDYQLPRATKLFLELVREIYRV